MFDPIHFEAARAHKAGIEAALGLRNDMEAYNEQQDAELSQDFQEQFEGHDASAVESDQTEGFNA